LTERGRANKLTPYAAPRPLSSDRISKQMIIDSHTHLTDQRFEGEVQTIVETLPQFNIEKIINVGYDMPSSRGSVELAEKYPRVYAAVGIHPHDSKNASAKDYEEIAEFVKNPKVVAIGEIGLDYFYDHSPRDTQQKVFVEQLELAHSLDMPVAIHLRDAYPDMLRILQQNRGLLKNGFLLHCYSGDQDYAAEFLKFTGAHFSFGGTLTFKNARHTVEVLKMLPRETLLVETDCPYLAPDPFRGKRNEPKYINYVVGKIGDILAISTENAVEMTKRNTETLFARIAAK